MFVPLLVLRNAFRHKLRTALTVLGIVVAIVAFGLLRTIVDAWYAGANASSSARLVTRSAVSLVFALPLTYAQRIRQVPGVTGVAWANWFGGVYITERNFFPQFAISTPTYLDLYPEFVLSDAERKAFLADRSGAIAGRKLADKYGWKVGDQIPLRGTIYPGTWTFNLRGIFEGAETSTDTSAMYFHFEYLNESIRRLYPRRADQAGVFIEQLRDPDEAAAVSQAIDATFRNSLAETLTETEKAFQLGFVAMSEAILAAIQAVSFVVIVIIMAVMANTMAMTARERYAEYATFKALGFGGGFVALLIFAESLGIALIGGALGIALTFPLAQAFASSVGAILSGFRISGETIALQVGAALVVGTVAAVVPAWRASRIRIVDGLRAIG
jgi:putative ABC transport system permease protein